MNKLVMFKVQLPYGQWYKAEHRQFIESLLNIDPDDAGVWEDKDKESDKYVLGMRQLNYSYIHDIVVDSENLARLSRFCRPIVMGSTTTTINLGSFAQRVEPVLNERVQVVVPGPALSSYDRVMVLEDCCTDALQQRMEEGWRILAIAVQPDQRRPDYIMGRVNDE